MKSSIVSIKIFLPVMVLLLGCGSKEKPAPAPPSPRQISLKQIFLNNTSLDNTMWGASTQPTIKLVFSEPVKTSTVASAVKLVSSTGVNATLNVTFQNKDSVVLLQPTAPLSFLTRYNFFITSDLKSSTDGSFISTVDKFFYTQIDSSRKFPQLSDQSLLDLVQQQTFKYFWDYGHPVSGLARERSISG